MALPASDSFVNTNGTALTTHNAAWAVGTGTFSIESNHAIATGFADTRAYWVGDSFSPSQYSWAIISGMSSSAQYRGVVARAFGSGGTYSDYTAFTDGASGAGHTEIGKTVNGSYSMLKAVATTVADGAKFEIRVTGTIITTIQLWIDDELIDSVTDDESPHTSGSAGIYAFGPAPGIDAWEAGNIGGTPGNASGAGQVAVASAPQGSAGSPAEASGDGVTATATAPEGIGGVAVVASGDVATATATAPSGSAAAVTVTITGLRLISENRAPQADLSDITALVIKQIPVSLVAPDKLILGVSTDSEGNLSDIDISDIQSTGDQVWLTLLLEPNLATTVRVTPVVT